MKLNFTYKLNYFLLILLITFGSSSVFSQENVVKGKIIDKETGEELIGASVVIKGTTNLIKGRLPVANDKYGRVGQLIYN